MKNSALSTVGTSLLGNLQRLAQTPAAQAQGLSEQTLLARNTIVVVKYLQRMDPAHRDCGAEINSITSLERKGYLRHDRAGICLWPPIGNARWCGGTRSAHATHS